MDVPVAGDDEPDLGADLDPEVVAAAQAEVGDHFQLTQLDHPFVRMLYRYCVRRTAKMARA